jgi:DNA polymerase I-like protein with 3'-5' exonuclease and polymerase domains
LNIHDDIGCEVPIELFREAAPLIHKTMEEIDIPFRVPLPASCEATATCWGDLKPVDLTNPVLPGLKS